MEKMKRREEIEAKSGGFGKGEREKKFSKRKVDENSLEVNIYISIKFQLNNIKIIELNKIIYTIVATLILTC